MPKQKAAAAAARNDGLNNFVYDKVMVLIFTGMVGRYGVCDPSGGVLRKP